MIAEFGASGSWPVQLYWRHVERRNIPKAGEVITVSEGLAAELGRRFGCHPVVLRNVPDVVPLARSIRLRAELGMTDDHRCLAVYQGVLIPGRGLEALVEATGRVQDLVLAVQGFGPEESQMRDRARNLGIEERVRFMGKKSPEDLHEYACGADIGVLIYEHTTLNNYLAGPNKLYSYLMAGLPVAGSAFPGIAEVIARGQVGLLFDPADPESISVALEGLVQDPAQRRAMGARARVLAETSYNWGLEKQALLEVYGRLEGASGSDGA
jgi:glycosyltransferase involved in cell wall biosynthesis